MENYTPEPNNGKKENLNNNKAGLFKTIGLAASVALFGGTEVVAKDNVSNPHNIHTEKVTSDNIDHLTNNPNAINFFRVSKSIDAVKYFENISDSISPESKKVITEQFVEQILKEINNDNFLEIMKLDWVIYAGDNGWTNTTPLHALAFKEIINKAKANIKNFEGTHLPKNRINIIVNKEIKTLEALKQINGFGRKKVEKYGQDIIEIIKAFYEIPDER